MQARPAPRPARLRAPRRPTRAGALGVPGAVSVEHMHKRSPGRLLVRCLVVKVAPHAVMGPDVHAHARCAAAWQHSERARRSLAPGSAPEAFFIPAPQELAEEYGKHRATEFNVGVGKERRGTGVRYADVAGIDHVKADIDAMMSAVLGKGGYDAMGVRPPRARALPAAPRPPSLYTVYTAALSAASAELRMHHSGCPVQGARSGTAAHAAAHPQAVAAACCAAWCCNHADSAWPLQMQRAGPACDVTRGGRAAGRGSSWRARPARARRTWPRPWPMRRACPSTRPTAPSSWRCSRASRRRASATCSRSRARTRRPSCSLVRPLPTHWNILR